MNHAKRVARLRDLSRRGVYVLDEPWKRDAGEAREKAIARAKLTKRDLRTINWARFQPTRASWFRGFWRRIMGR